MWLGLSIYILSHCSELHPEKNDPPLFSLCGVLRTSFFCVCVNVRVPLFDGRSEVLTWNDHPLQNACIRVLGTRSLCSRMFCFVSWIINLLNWTPCGVKRLIWSLHSICLHLNQPSNLKEKKKQTYLFPCTRAQRILVNNLIKVSWWTGSVLKLMKSDFCKLLGES